ncbi:hypothetical protein Cs308_0051 [Candidatus Chlamydia sanziniae]|uniref:Uncharacterized protein n=1 Tax=Candidatus Chlamydia sanziniae TaxID=1806891 RepID=A0A1A9HU42_9CHLA|nr:hypothetical protein Cs308_0051 [Candidatus Chlamydia sanziniae]
MEMTSSLQKIQLGERNFFLYFLVYKFLQKQRFKLTWLLKRFIV